MNLQQVGRKISELRKSRDMTQNELAEKAGVSYQAVSSWERGLTMPDVGKLPGISQILGVSIDQLLDNEKEVAIVKNVLSNNIEVYAEAEPLHIDEIAEVAPILKPSQVKDLVQHIEPESIDLSSLMTLAPFVSQDILDEMAIQAFQEGDIQTLMHIAPHLSSHALNHLALTVIEVKDLESLTYIAPFVSRDTLDQLALQTDGSHSLEILTRIAPFVSRNTLDKLALDAIDGGDIGSLCAIAPFVSQGILDQLALKAPNASNINQIHSIAPFLSKGVIDKLVLKAIGRDVDPE